MAGAIAFQGWLSIAKPFPRTPWSAPARRAKPRTASAWIFAMGSGAVLADLAVVVVLGYPLPAFSIVTLVVVLILSGVETSRSHVDWGSASETPWPMSRVGDQR